jgi:hypothetical protein
MLLFTSAWKGIATFKMLPITENCPFSEVIYDPTTTILVVIAKTKINNFQMVPRLDDNGYPIAVKGKAGEVPYQQQRISLEMLQEHYITEVDEQEAFIKYFAMNADVFKYKNFLRDMSKEITGMGKEVTDKRITDASGNPIIGK